MAESARHPDVEMRINEHLEAIDKVLAAKGVPLTERRSVTSDVEAQIRDMLAASIGGNPTADDVEAILHKVDAPEFYAGEAESAPVQQPPWAVQAAPPRFSRAAIAGAAWAPLFFIFLFLMFFVRQAVRVPGQPPSGATALQILAWFTLMPLGLLAPFGTTILGWIAVGQIRRSNGGLCGLGLALADSLIFPLLLLNVLIYCFWRVVMAVVISWKSWDIEALWHPNYPSADQNIMLIFVVTAATALVIDWLIVRWAWRKGTL